MVFKDITIKEIYTNVFYIIYITILTTLYLYTLIYLDVLILLCITRIYGISIYLHVYS